MTPERARKWLILFALASTAAHFIFFIVAPVLGYKLHSDEAIQMLEIVGPVFLGYVGAATQYLFQTKPVTARAVVSEDLLKILVKGPAYVFTVISAAAIFAFGYANRAGGPGMLPSHLSLILAANIGLLTVSTNVIVSNLFHETKK